MDAMGLNSWKGTEDSSVFYYICDRWKRSKSELFDFCLQRQMESDTDCVWVLGSWPATAKTLLTTNKIRLYQTLVMSVLLYAAETWTFLSGDEKTLGGI